MMNQDNSIQTMRPDMPQDLESLLEGGKHVGNLACPNMGEDVNPGARGDMT